MKKVLALAVVSAMLLSACATQSTPSTSASAAPKSPAASAATTPASAAATPASSQAASTTKDTITWAQYADITSLDPHIGKETPALQVTCQIFNSLVTADDVDMKIKPSIAESWENISDKAVKFKLRKDIKFHDGTPLTAKDVKFSLDRAIASTSVSYIVNFIQSVEINDDYTVTVTSKEPYAPILMNLSHPCAAIVPKAATEANPDMLKTKPIGSGPYKFVEWKQGEFCKLVANDDYFGGKPKTKNLVMRVVPETAQRTIALETGEIDLAYDINPNDMKKIKENAKLSLFEAPSLSCWYITFNTKKEPFNKPLVRQAIRTAIDRQLIVDTIAYGAGEIAATLIPPKSFGYIQGIKAYDYDPKKAKELLTEAGYPNGFKTTLWVNDNQQRIEICQVVQSQLKEIGIECSIEVMETSSFVAKSSAGDHNMAFFGWTTSTADADYTYYPILHSSQAGTPGNRSFIANKDLDALLEQARATMDSAKRLDLYKKVEDILYAESPNAPIYYNSITVGASKSVQNFIINPAGYHKLAGVAVNK